MNIEQRMQYYQECINKLTPPKSARSRFLIEVYNKLIEDSKSRKEEH